MHVPKDQLERRFSNVVQQGNIHDGNESAGQNLPCGSSHVRREMVH